MSTHDADPEILYLGDLDGQSRLAEQALEVIENHEKEQTFHHPPFRADGETAPRAAAAAGR